MTLESHRNYAPQTQIFIKTVRKTVMTTSLSFDGKFNKMYEFMFLICNITYFSLFFQKHLLIIIAQIVIFCSSVRHHHQQRCYSKKKAQTISYYGRNIIVHKTFCYANNTFSLSLSRSDSVSVSHPNSFKYKIRKHPTPASYKSESSLKLKRQNYPRFSFLSINHSPLLWVTFIQLPPPPQEINPK